MKKLFVYLACSVALFVVLGNCTTMKEYEYSDEIVSVEWLSQHLSDEDLVVVHLSSMDDSRLDYENGHIPGALFVNGLQDLSEPSAAVMAMMLNSENFEALMAKLGVNNSSTVVVYDLYGGEWAARLWWGLQYYGHTKAKLLSGGINKWKEEDYTLETGSSSYPGNGTFRAVEHPELLADLSAVQAAISDHNIAIIDALPAVFYTSGHIPSAINMPAADNYRADFTYLSRKELDELWSKAGLTPDQEIITYCGAGYFGAYDLFTLRQIGYHNVRLYDGSMMEWQANNLPLTTGSNP